MKYIRKWKNKICMWRRLVRVWGTRTRGKRERRTWGWESNHMWNTKGRSVHTRILTFKSIVVRSINTRNTLKGNVAVSGRGNWYSSCCEVSSPNKNYLLFLIFDHTWKAFQINASTRSTFSIMYNLFLYVEPVFFCWKSIEVGLRFV